MPVLNLITEIIPKNSEVLITNPHSRLGSEILYQLKSHSFISTVPVASIDNLPQLDSLSVVLHLAGFDSQLSLAQTLSYTTHLFSLLSLSKQFQAKFILVISNTHNHLYHTALTIVSQYAKSHPIKYLILEIDKSSPVAETAAEIIKKFVYSHQRPSQHPSVLPHNRRHVQKTIKPIDLKKIALWLVAILILPYFTYGLIQITSIGLTFCSAYQIQKLSLPKAATCATYLKKTIDLLNVKASLLPGASGISRVLGYPLPEYSAVTASLSDTLQLLNQSLQTGQKMFTNFYFPENPNSSALDAGQLASLLSTSSESVSLLQGRLKSYFLTSQNPHQTFKLIAEFSSNLPHALANLSVISSSLPKLLSSESGAKILFLVQDNTELKPSGGFIDSLMLVTVKNLQVTQIQLTTSRSADNQLVGVATAPSDFQKVTKKNNWLLSDSNWDIDFAVSAKRAAWFVEKELSFSPDLVIALNLNAIQAALQVLGPIAIPEYSLKVSSDDLYSKYHSFIKNNPQADSFIFKLLNHLVDRSKNMSSNQIENLLLKFLVLLENRQILVYSPKNTAPEIIPSNWSGGVSPQNCRRQTDCLVDFLSLVDTNYGGNKSDASISKNLVVETKISSKEVTTSYFLSYANKSTDTVWPSGSHKNYLRVLIPHGTSVKEISLNEEILLPDKYTLSSQSGLSIVGLIIDTPPGSVSTIVLKTAKSFLPSKRFYYQMDILNQPGASSFPVKISVVYPKTWLATSFSQASVASPGLLQYNSQISKPLNYGIDFSIQ